MTIAPPRARPRSVVLAARLMIAAAAVAAVSLVLLLARGDAVRDRLRDATPRPSEGSVHTAMTVTTLTHVAFLVLFPLLTRHVTQGRPWARTATWVLAALGLLSTWTLLVRPQLGLPRLLAIVAVVLDIAVGGLLATRPSGRWFRDGRRA